MLPHPLCGNSANTSRATPHISTASRATSPSALAMANHEAAEAASIRTEAREALNLHSDGQHEDALARAIVLAGVHPGPALALNLAGLLHRHAALVARNDRDAPSDDDDDEDVSVLEEYHRHAALDAFSAAARLAPDCVVTNVDHAEALADCRRNEDAQKEFLRMLNTVENNDHADPALHNVVYDMSGDSSRKARRRDAVNSSNLAMERFAERINHRILPLEAAKLLDATNLGGRAADEARDRAKLLAETYPYSPRAQLLHAYIDLAPVRALDAAMDKKQLLRRVLSIVSQAAENFDCSLMVALFHAKLLFVLDEFDAAEGECRRALHIETSNVLGQKLVFLSLTDHSFEVEEDQRERGDTHEHREDFCDAHHLASFLGFPFIQPNYLAGHDPIIPRHPTDRSWPATTRLHNNRISKN